MSESGPVPSSWSELLVAIKKSLPSSERFVLQSAEDLVNARPREAVGCFCRLGDTFTKIALAAGVQAARPHFDRFQAALPIAMQALSANVEYKWLPATWLLSYVSVARCCGSALPSEALAIERDWISIFTSIQGKMQEKESYDMAFVALGIGAFDLVPVFMGGDALPESALPGQTFDLNVEKFVRYMAASAARGAKADDVRPAFEAFVQLFPFKLGAKSLGWLDLMSAARAYYVHFEGRPVETVGQALYDLVHQLAADEGALEATVIDIQSLLALTPELRITYDIGQEYSPVDPFGRTTLVLEGTGRVRLDVRGAGRPPRDWEAQIEPAELTELLEALRRAGFPVSPQEMFVPGASIGMLRVEKHGAHAEVKIDRYKAEALPGYREAYAALDRLAFRLSGGATAPVA